MRDARGAREGVRGEKGCDSMWKECEGKCKGCKG